MRALPPENSIIKEIVQGVKTCSTNMQKMCDFAELNEAFNGSENISQIRLKELRLGEGVSEYEIEPKEGLYYSVVFKVLDDTKDIPVSLIIKVPVKVIDENRMNNFHSMLYRKKDEISDIS